MMDFKYADIIVNIAHEKVDRPFQYKIPPKLKDRIQIGTAVMIPFGRGNKKLLGYVVSFSNTPFFDENRLKEIEGVVEENLPVETNLLKLAGWMKEQYGSTMITALKTVLPVKQKTKALEKKKVVLLLSEKDAKEKCEFYEKKHQVARERLLDELIREGEIPFELVTGKLNVSGQTVKALEEQGILKIEILNPYRNPIHIKEGIDKSVTLSLEQTRIIDTVCANQNKGIHRTYLIHGITGSGKTEVYMELIKNVLVLGKQAIVLIPEIALTYQTVMRFFRRFGNRVSVMNSKLSAGERYDQFERAKAGEVDIMIGPRSALFTPFRNLGIIIIDEEHENSYKSENIPKYHARETAIQMASYYDADVILGSATPSLEAYYRAKCGEYELFELTKRLTGGSLPTVYTVDLRQELKKGNRTIFSKKLQELITDRLNSHKQIMLFLNRRGYAGFVSCRSCGHVMKCPHCDVSLSEHRNGKLICHYCGYEIPMVTKCPECGSKYILGFKAGTQQIEEQLHKVFPRARVLRMDGDTTKKKNSYEAILEAFGNGEADILVGTQMIVKGHDFPDVTLVGVLAADLSLFAGDFRAGERTFQLLTQAAGRAGRGDSPGEVVIQTYQPEHYSVVHAANQDYKAFYEEEMVYRELMHYPPAGHMLAVLVQSVAQDEGETLASDLIKSIKGTAKDKKALIIGPAPASISKVNDIYRTIFYIKNRDYEVLKKIKDQMESYLNEMEMKTETVQFDFDPINTY